ncbi:hypothetical protein B0T25DRAFT_453373 [Lasiosphaeria hispida]|uniref:SH3 domain-containing protein n=1 Tax=Lasiosphaeria hispida TaxID=260671 RepID=A0AAJ0MDZ4_9PEZI|nr:hypothetical protein B0T25DRAFT_453373 [Lasiosphaeria hispida]
MDDDVQNLVLAPFRDVVEKGKTAVDNAKDAGLQPMQKAAQNLVNNAERALKKIEPVCRRQLEEYGPSFIDALKENDEISGFREQLNEMLWDLDDCIEADSFNPETYTKLQALLRAAALKITDIVLRMKLEQPVIDSGSSIRSRAWGIQQMLMHNSSQEVKAPVEPRPIDADSVRPEDIPPEPPANPWELVEPPPDVSGLGIEDVPDRRPRVFSAEEEQRSAHNPVTSATGGGSWTDAQPSSSSGLLFGRIIGSPTPPPSVGDRHSSVALSYRSSVSTSNPLLSSPRYSQVSTESSNNTSIIDRRARDSVAVSPINEAMNFVLPGACPAPLFSDQSQAPSAAPSPAPTFSSPAPTYSSPAPTFPTPASTHSVPVTHSSPLARPPSVDARGSSAPYGQPGLVASAVAPVAPVAPAMAFEDGLIPVTTEEVEHSGLEVVNGSQPSPTVPRVLREPDRTIDTTSSFHQCKGFCEGGKEIIRGGLGVKKSRQPAGVLGAGMVNVAKCKNCLYQLDWGLVEADLHRHSDSNYKTAGVGFRLRFLSKSHLPARRVDDQLYSCLFCIQAGQTVDESDATVFFSQKQLFTHLSRHPRPLPPVPGLTVIDGPVVPPAYQNNYDLHFASPPARGPTADLTAQLALLPTAVTSDTIRQGPQGMRAAPDRAPVLQFAPGAKIVGIEFPPSYGGEWAMGWADGVRAAFPLDAVRLRAPREGGVVARMQAASGSSARTAVARWKRNPKEAPKETLGSREALVAEGQWLKFGKGESVTGISFPYHEYWCWAGYNAKGKWGIFPQAFLDPGSLTEGAGGGGSNRASSIWSQEGVKTGGIGSVFRRKRRGSTSGQSHSSGDTTGAQRSPRPSVY